MLPGTGAIGTETPEASITETGVAGTGAYLEQKHLN